MQDDKHHLAKQHLAKKGSWQRSVSHFPKYWIIIPCLPHCHLWRIWLYRQLCNGQSESARAALDKISVSNTSIRRLNLYDGTIHELVGIPLSFRNALILCISKLSENILTRGMGGRLCFFLYFCAHSTYSVRWWNLLDKEIVISNHFYARIANKDTRGSPGDKWMQTGYTLMDDVMPPKEQHWSLSQAVLHGSCLLCYAATGSGCPCLCWQLGRGGRTRTIWIERKHSGFSL